MCSEPAGEHGWKTQLSARLGPGREVRASLPALPLGAERAALLSAARGGGGIDQGQGSCVIKGGPGIKGALPKDSRMAPPNPRRFTPSVSSDAPYIQEVQNSHYKLYKKVLLYPRMVFRQGWQGEGLKAFFLASAKNSEPSGRDTTHLTFFFEGKHSLKSSLYESGHLKDRTLATLVSRLSFPWEYFLFRLGRGERSTHSNLKVGS